MPHKYGAIDPSPFSANQRILELLGAGSRVLGPGPGQKSPDVTGVVLDVGCSTGYLAAELRRCGYSVYGIEAAPDAASEAARYCQRVWTADLDVLETLDCGPIFDVIVLADILEHTRDPEGNLRKLLAYLRDGGRVICSLPNIANWRIRLSLLIGRFDYTSVGILDESHLRFFTRRTAERMMSRLGLRIERMMVTPSFLPYRLYRLYPLKWLDYALCRILPGIGAQQFIFEMRRSLTGR